MADDLRNIFISHRHEDDPGLGKFKSLLEKNGMRVRDYSVSSDNPNNAHSEEYIKSKILKPRIEACGCFVVYISPHTKDSPYVNWEIEYAHRLGKRIVGVWAHGEKGCEIPKALDDYADAIVGWAGDSIVDAINGKINGWNNPDGSECGSRDIERYSCGK